MDIYAQMARETGLSRDRLVMITSNFMNEIDLQNIWGTDESLHVRAATMLYYLEHEKSRDSEILYNIMADITCNAVGFKF